MSQITLAFCLLSCSTRMNWYLALADLQPMTLYLKWKFLRHWVFWWHRGDSSFTVYSSFVRMCFTCLSKMGGHQPRYSINYPSISFQNVPYSINLPIFKKLAYLGHFFFLDYLRQFHMQRRLAGWFIKRESSVPVAKCIWG